MADILSGRDDGGSSQATELEKKVQSTRANRSSRNDEDPGEIEVLISSHRRNASAYLGRHLDAKASLSDTPPTAGGADSLGERSVSINEASRKKREKKPDAREMAVVASRDQLQLHLVPLCNLLSRLHREAHRLAIRSGLYFFSASVAKIAYRTSIPYRLYSENFNNYLSGCVGLSALYGAYRIAMWSLVYVRWHGTASLKRRLDEGQVMEEDRHDLDGSSWSQIESYSSVLR